MGRILATRTVTRLTVGEEPRTRSDVLAGEEPLEIRVGGRALAVTMRTPGHDFELAAGFLVSEGVIRSGSDFREARFCPGDGDENTFNVLDVTLAPEVPEPSPDIARNFYTSSSCGVCGKASIEAVETVSPHDVAAIGTFVESSLLVDLPDRLRESQNVFEQTGGLHAAGLFDAVTGEKLVVREDIGRHNAVDKVIGWALMQNRLPLERCVLQVSGRASFELIQKARMAGVPVFSAVSAPSSLAVDLAVASGITLAGFVRGDSMVVYSRMDRIRTAADGRTGSEENESVKVFAR